MREPHVESLRYRLKTGETTQFNGPPPLTHETAAFRLHLQDEIVTVEMLEHHPTEESARACVGPFLRAWELDVCLRWGAGAIRFEFEDCHIIDRRPPPPDEPRTATAFGIAPCWSHAFGWSAKVVHGHGMYPDPPTKFKTTAEVEMMWERNQLIQDGKGLLLDTANFCLTLFEGTTGRMPKDGARDEAARMYKVDRDVLAKLGKIVATRGDHLEARKFDVDATRTPLTEKEKQWIDDVVKALIRRKAEYDADPGSPLPLITLSDFITL